MPNSLRLCRPPGLPVHHQLPEFTQLMSIDSVMPSNHLILCRSLLLPPSIFPSIRVFSNELILCIRWPKYWSFSSSISPSNEYSGLISFRIEWFHVLFVQGTLCNPMNYSPPGSYVHGDSPGKNIGVGSHSLLQGIFPTQGSNPGLPHWQVDSSPP